MKVFFAVLLMLSIALPGCVTVTYPDGTTENRIDAEMASLALEGAVLAYNLYIQSDQDEPSPSRLTQLLNNIERAEALYNRLRDTYGGKEKMVVPMSDGQREIKYNE